MFGERTGANERLQIKICGITNAEDARLAVEGGADAVGLNFFSGSKRCIDARKEGEWLAELSAKVCRVAILVNPTWEEALAAAALPFIDALQLHGSESPEFCQRLARAGIRLAKAVPVSENKAPDDLPDYGTDTILLDSSSRHGFGGTGEPFAWPVGRRFIEKHPALRIILAGGLTPENVAEAVATVRPFGVDVTTGVEASPGRKDPARLRAFLTALGRG